MMNTALLVKNWTIKMDGSKREGKPDYVKRFRTWTEHIHY